MAKTYITPSKHNAGQRKALKRYCKENRITLEQGVTELWVNQLKADGYLK